MASVRAQLADLQARIERLEAASAAPVKRRAVKDTSTVEKAVKD